VLLLVSLSRAVLTASKKTEMARVRSGGCVVVVDANLRGWRGEGA
jgi:hypothetical protein